MSAMITGLDRLLAFVEKAAVLVALGLLVGITSYQLVMRNLNYVTSDWIDPLLHQLVLWAGFLGAALAVRAQTHIRFDLILPRLSPRWSLRVGVAVSIGSAFVCIVLAKASWMFVLSERESFSNIAGVPSWVFTSIIPLAFLLMAIHFLSAPWLTSKPDEGIGGGAR